MSTTTISPLRQRMIEDMTARKFGPASQRSHLTATGSRPRPKPWPPVTAAG